MQKTKGTQAKFFFNIRRALIKEAQTGTLNICIRRKDKAVYSKDFQFSAETLEVVINEKLEFPTMVDHDGDGYKSKTVTMQAILTFPNGSTYQAAADVQLTDFVGSEALFQSIKLKGDNRNLQVDFDCSSTLTMATSSQFRSASNIQSTHSEFHSKPEVPEHNKSSKQLGLQVRRKEKTLLTIAEGSIDDHDVVHHAKGFSTCETPQVGKLGLRRSNTNCFDAGRKREFTFGEVAQESGEKFRHQEWVGCQPIKEQDGKSEPEPQPEKKQSTSLGKFNTSTSIQEKVKKSHVSDQHLQTIRQLNDQVKQLELVNKSLEAENKKLTKQKRQLEERLSLATQSQQGAQDSQSKLVERLKEDIQAKNRQIKESQQQIERQKNFAKQQQSLTVSARKQIDKLILKGSNVSTSSSNGKDYSKEIEKFKKEYEERIEQLKEQNTKLKALSEPKGKIDICLSKNCDIQKKDLKAKLKQIQKTLDEKDVQIETKQRLIKSYQNAKKDRQTDNASIDMSKQMDKWRSQRLILEQQIQQLKSSKRDGGKAQDKQDILTLKIQKQTMSRQMERVKRTLGQVTKDKESVQNLSQKLQEQLINTKQKVMDLLNGIQQYGGMKLYDTICNMLE